MKLNPLFSAASRFCMALGLLGLTASTASAGEVRFDGGGHAQNPVWSKDGKFLSFEVNRYGANGTKNIDMFIAEIQGDMAKGQAMPIVLPGGGSGFGGADTKTSEQAVWHQEGIVIFQGSNTQGMARLYFASPGASPSQMLNTSEAPGVLSFPALSPDGNLMAYTTSESGDGDVRVWNRVSGQIANVTTQPGNDVNALFSPDGSQIIYTRKVNGGEDIYRVAMGSTNGAPIVSTKGDQTRPTFAMGGNKIVYFSNDRTTEEWDLVVADASGSNAKRVASHVKLPQSARPAISADGNWVAYTYAEDDKAKQVVLMRVDGSRTVKIDTGFEACAEPALTSVGGRHLLAFAALPAEGSAWKFLYVKDITSSL